MSMILRRFPLVFLLAAGLLAGCGAAAAASGEDRVEQVTPEPGVTPLPAHVDTGTLAWHREGGIAGFCDDVSVSLDGSYTIDGCGARPKNHRTGQLSASQLEQLTGWAAKFQSFDTSKDQGPVVPDGMIQAIVFTGTGTAQPSPDNLAAITQFAQTLLTQAPGPNP
jgi:hypothetical protein